MVERRMSVLIAVMIVFLASAVLWDVFVHPPRARPRPAPPPAPAAGATAPAAPSPPVSLDSPAPAATPPAEPASYLVLLARAETRRRIRASAGLTYLNEIVAASGDSMLHRWDNRILRPVRVYLPAGTVANFRPGFLDDIRQAFARWQDAGVPVRFNLDADSTVAEVRFQWRVQFDQQRTGQTELLWDQEGHLLSGIVTLATFDPKGQPLGEAEMRVVALHEIGHLIGLDHSSDSTDIMFAITRVRDLSARDIQTAQLLYELASGSLR